MSQNNILHEQIKIDFSDNKAVKSAVDAFKEMGKANGIANSSLTELNKSAKNAKKLFEVLSTQYGQFTDEVKSSQFGKDIKKRMDEAASAFNGFQSEINKAKESLKGLEDSDFNIKVKAEIDKPNKLSNVSDMLDKAGFGGASKAVGGLGEMLGGTLSKGALAAGAGIAAAGIAIKTTVDVTKKAIEKSAEFGKSMSELGALVGLAGKDLDAMRVQVMGVATDTDMACSEVARNFALIGSALPDLLGDADGLETVSRAAITLSKAGLMPLDEATNALTNTMAQFGLGSDQAAMVIDTLANASNAGNAEIGDISETLTKVGTAANQAGINLQETSSLIEVLGARGLKGAEAGTQLRNVLLTMNTSVDDFNPKAVGMQKALENLAKHSSDSAFMVDMFGKQASTAASILAAGVPQYMELMEAMEKVGSAEQMAETNTDNLATKWEETKTKWDNFLAGMNVDGSDSPLMRGVQAIQNMIDYIDDAFSELADSEGLAALGQTMGDLFEGVGEAINQVISIVGDLIDGVIEVADSFGLIEGLSSIWSTIFKAISLVCQVVGDVVRLFKLSVDSFHNFMRNLWGKVGEIPFVKKLIDGLNKVIDTIKEVKKWWDKIHNIIRTATTESSTPKSNTKKETTPISTITNDNGGTNDNGSTNDGKGKKANPKQTYNNAINKADFLKEMGFYSDYGLENERKAIEAKIKATEDYINKLSETTDSIKKNKPQIKELNRARQIYKNHLTYISDSIDDNKTISDANEEYADAIYKLNEDREHGWVTEEEYNKQYISALQNLIKKYKDVGVISQELVNKINEKRNEINNVELKEKAINNSATNEASMADFYNVLINNGKMNDLSKKLAVGAEKVIIKVVKGMYRTVDSLMADIKDGLKKEELVSNWEEVLKLPSLEEMEDYIWDHQGDLIPIPKGEGDLSNYSLSTKSSNKINKIYGQDSIPKSYGRNEGGLMTNRLEDDQKKLQALIDKYKELEDIALEIYKTPEGEKEFGGEIETLMKDVEGQISDLHDKIQDKLIFKLQFQGFQDAMQYATDFSSSLSTVAQFGDAWESAGENANGFVATMERFALVMSTVQAIITAVNGAINIFNAIQDVLAAKNTATQAIEATTAGAVVTAKNAVTDATLSSAAAKIFEAHSAIPFAGVPTATSMVEAMLATMAEVKAAGQIASAFANGGIVDYGSFYGDTTLARVNKGEMILNQRQQGNLFNTLNNGTQMGAGDVTFKIKGDALYGVLKNYNKIKTKTGHSISFD